jgi:hypothetical protein
MLNKTEFIELLQSTDPTEIEIIKSILKQANIRFYFKGLALGRIFPTMNKPVRLMVEKDRLDEAQVLLGGHTAP